MTMAVASFTVSFDGDALREGSIDVKTLAPSLLALGDLVEEANRVLNEDHASARLRVRGSFRQGSFDSTLELTISLYEYARSVLLLHEVQDAKQLLETLGFFGGSAAAGLWWLIKRINGRRVSRARTTIETDLVVLELDDGEEIEAKRNVADLYNDNNVIRASREVLRPLDMEGVDSLSISYAEGEPQVIEKSDIHSFDAPLSEVTVEEILSESTTKRALIVVRPSFSEGYVWTLSDGDSTLSARMNDSRFLAEVDRGLGFSRGSVIEADISSTTTRTPTGRLSTQNTIERVHRVIPPPRQTRLDFESGDE